jgi:4-amino-4-deoxy-L-arabinose transferase-like glycosyltransferase
MPVLSSNSNEKNLSSAVVALCFLIVFPLVIWILLRLFDFNGLYGQDAYEYLRYADALVDWMKKGNPPGDYFWPVNYPFFGALGGYLTGNTLACLQFISVFSLTAAAFVVYRVLGDFRERNSDKNILFLYCFCCCLMAPFLLRSAMLVMSDSVAILGVVCFYYGYFRYERTKKAKWLLLLSAAAGAAVMTRYALAIFLVLPALHLLVLVFKNRHWYLLFPAIVLAALFLIPHGWIRYEEPFAFLGHNYLGEWSWQHWFQRVFNRQDGQVAYRLPNLLYAFSYVYHPGFFLLGAVILPFVKWSDWKPMVQRITLFSVLLYTFFIAGIGFQNQRFLLPLLPLVLILFYPAFLRSWHWLQTKIRLQRKWFFVGLVSLQLVLFVYSFNTVWLMNRVEKTIATSLQAYPADHLYCFYLDPALESYQVPQKLINLWKEPITRYKIQSYILFHPTRFSHQWEGHTLMENWAYLRKNYHLEELESFPDGWVLYQIKNQK